MAYLTERGAEAGSPGRISPTLTRASGSVNGGGVSRTASTTAKIDAPAPSVSDSVKTAAAALAGERRRVSQQVTKVDEHWRLLRVLFPADESRGGMQGMSHAHAHP